MLPWVGVLTQDRGRSCLLEVPVDVLGRILNAGC